jgi:hypothetical protein
MLKASFQYLKQRLSLINKTMEAVDNKALTGLTDVKTEKRTEDDSLELNTDAKKLRTELSNESKVSKRKYALLIGYCGEGYYGLQR